MTAVAEWPATHNGKAKHAPAAWGHRVVPGSTREGLYREWYLAGCRLGVEIGVADGRNAFAMFREIADLELLCVDPWQKYADNPRGGPDEQHRHNYTLAHERLQTYHPILWRMTSMEAIAKLRSEVPAARRVFDFVYIDGHHGFDYVMRDLIEWSRQVRSGGIVAGHDFYHFQWAGVVEAVTAYTNAHGITNWHLTDEREPSFWWVKP